MKEVRQGLLEVKGWYERLPYELTKLKMDLLLSNFSFNQRLVGLSLSSVLASWAFLGLSAYRFPRNSVLSFWAMGLAVMPEIYNPLFK
jgi:hypothetical protein